jgi:hypothetical protein
MKMANKLIPLLKDLDYYNKCHLLHKMEACHPHLQAPSLPLQAPNLLPRTVLSPLLLKTTK